jgi:hypothetical protein
VSRTSSVISRASLLSGMPTPRIVNVIGNLLPQ